MPTGSPGTVCRASAQTRLLRNRQQDQTVFVQCDFCRLAVDSVLNLQLLGNTGNRVTAETFVVATGRKGDQRDVAGMFAQPGCLRSPRFMKMWYEIVRFSRGAAEVLEGPMTIELGKPIV